MSLEERKGMFMCKGRWVYFMVIETKIFFFFNQPILEIDQGGVPFYKEGELP